MELVQIFFFKNLIKKVAVITNFLAFFQLLVDKFTLLDPDPGGTMNADPCGSGSGSTALVTPILILVMLCINPSRMF